jgi:hypothetical protein
MQLSSAEAEEAVLTEQEVSTCGISVLLESLVNLGLAPSHSGSTIRQKFSLISPENGSSPGSSGANLPFTESA